MGKIRTTYNIIDLPGIKEELAEFGAHPLNKLCEEKKLMTRLFVRK